MDTVDITIRLDKDVRDGMVEVCDGLGMSLPESFAIFAKAFVRDKGFPFPVKILEASVPITREKMLEDAESVLSEFQPDYKRMAE